MNRYFLINEAEFDCLEGLPYKVVVAYFKIRLRMNDATGLVGGGQYGYSYRRLAKDLEVFPHQGRRETGVPSQGCVRNIILILEKAGLIKNLSDTQSVYKKLILKCPLAMQNFCALKKLSAFVPNKHGIVDKERNDLKNNTLTQESTLKFSMPLTQQHSNNQKEKNNKLSFSSSRESKKSTVINETFQPAQTTLAKAKKLGCSCEAITHEVAKFIAYYKSQGTPSYDWQSSFLMWLLRHKEYQQRKLNTQQEQTNAAGISYVQPNPTKPTLRRGTSALEKVLAAERVQAFSSAPSDGEADSRETEPFGFLSDTSLFNKESD